VHELVAHKDRVQQTANTLQHAAARCNTLQHAATRCNTPVANAGEVNPLRVSEFVAHEGEVALNDDEISQTSAL